MLRTLENLFFFHFHSLLLNLIALGLVGLLQDTQRFIPFHALSIESQKPSAANFKNISHTAVSSFSTPLLATFSWFRSSPPRLSSNAAPPLPIYGCSMELHTTDTFFFLNHLGLFTANGAPCFSHFPRKNRSNSGNLSLHSLVDTFGHTFSPVPARKNHEEKPNFRLQSAT